MDYQANKSVEQNQEVPDTSVPKRLISKTFIYSIFALSSIITAFIFLSQLTSLFEVTHIERLFFRFMSYREYNEDLIVFLLLINLILSIILGFSMVWNVAHKDTKWLFVLALIETVAIISSMIFVGMLAMGGPKHLSYRSEICASFSNKKETDTCFKETALSLPDCKKILDFDKRDKCTNFLLNYPKITEEVSSCTLFETERNRDDCVINYTSKNDASLCLYLENIPKREPCLVRRSNNPEQCSLIESSSLKGKCFASLEFFKNYSNSCSIIKDERSRLFCHLSIIHLIEKTVQSPNYDRQNKISKYCLEPQSDEIKSFVCGMSVHANERQTKKISELEELMKKEAYCNIATSTSTKEWCTGQIVIDRSQYTQADAKQHITSLCTGISYPDDRFLCYESIIHYNQNKNIFDNEELCLKITDISVREKCQRKSKIK